MRIGLFTDTYYPRQNGAAISVFILKENLEALGHEVHVFTTTDPDAPGSERNVVRIPSIPFKTQRLGTFVSPVVIRRAGKLGLEVIHTHTEYTLGCFGMILARRAGVPHIHTMHTIYEFYTNYIIRNKRFESSALAVARRFTATFCNSADLVIAPTEKINDLLMGYGVHAPIRVIPSGIQLERFGSPRGDAGKYRAIRGRLGIMDGDKVLLYVGRVAHEKNLGELITGLREYLLSHPRVKLVIIGDGLAREGLEALAGEMGLRAQVVFGGAQPWDEIDMYYRLGDLFVGASQSETQGLTYIEAMASGLPVIAKEDRCLDGVLENGWNGYSFKDADGLAGAVAELFGDHDKLKRFSRNASETAIRFSAGSYASGIASVYAQTKSKRARRREERLKTD